jgi:hypothetical protein
LQVVSEHVDELVSSGTFERTISNFDTNFSRLLLDLLDRILDMSSQNYDHKLSNIIYRSVFRKMLWHGHELFFRALPHVGHRKKNFIVIVGFQFLCVIISSWMKTILVFEMEGKMALEV